MKQLIWQISFKKPELYGRKYDTNSKKYREMNEKLNINKHF